MKGDFDLDTLLRDDEGRLVQNAFSVLSGLREMDNVALGIALKAVIERQRQMDRARIESDPGDDLYYQLGSINTMSAVLNLKGQADALLKQLRASEAQGG